MRSLGFALIVASLVVSTGGVAVRGHAGTAPNDPRAQAPVVSRAQFGMTPVDEGVESVPAAPALTQPAACQPLESAPIRIALPTSLRDRRVLPLSNRGHNYRGGLAELSAPIPAAPRKP
jgi:hypothetical protein